MNLTCKNQLKLPQTTETEVKRPTTAIQTVVSRATSRKFDIRYFGYFVDILGNTYPSKDQPHTRLFAFRMFVSKQDLHILYSEMYNMDGSIIIVLITNVTFHCQRTTLLQKLLGLTKQSAYFLINLFLQLSDIFSMTFIDHNFHRHIIV